MYSSSTFDLVIANGTLITSRGARAADVAVSGERIAAVGGDLPGDRIIDATGCYVLPGAIDAHVHLEMPVGDGTFVSSDDFVTGTVAAAHGGTTTVLDFVQPDPGQSMLQALAARRERADGRAVIDYGLHMTIPAWHADQQSASEEITKVIDCGLPTFKLYLAYDGLRLDDGQLYRVLRILAAQGSALPIVHCENGLVCDALRADALSKGHRSALYHALTRPPRQEAEAAGRVLDIAALAGAPVYVVHVSCAEAMERLIAARKRGQCVLCETCPQYLSLGVEAYEGPGAERFICAPPLRSSDDQSALWHALSAGEIDVVATDHCPFTLAQKASARDFTGVPGGLPGIEARLSLLYTLGVARGRLSLSQWVDCCCSAPARLFGLTGKGQIAPGFDADLVIFDPASRISLCSAALHENAGWTPYQGLELCGWPRTTLSRGTPIVDEGHFVGQSGRGRFVPRGLDPAALRPQSD